VSVYGKGKCFLGLTEECRFGDEGIEANPVYCLTCAVLKLAEAVEMLKEE